MNHFSGMFDGAPQSGRILAYSSEKLIYDAYSLENGSLIRKSGDVLSPDGIYELHLFDADTEYRALYENGSWKTSVLSRQNEPEDDIDHFVFSETQFVQARYCIDRPDEKIVVNNYFSFDQEGFLRLTGYRLAMEPA